MINDGGFQMYNSGDNFLGFKLPNGNYGYIHVNYDPAGSVYTFTRAPTKTRGPRSPRASYLSPLPLPYCLSPEFARWEFVVRYDLVMPAHVIAGNIQTPARWKVS